MSRTNEVLESLESLKNDTDQEEIEGRLYALETTMGSSDLRVKYQLESGKERNTLVQTPQAWDYTYNLCVLYDFIGGEENFVGATIPLRVQSGDLNIDWPTMRAEVDDSYDHPDDIGKEIDEYEVDDMSIPSSVDPDA